MAHLFLSRNVEGMDAACQAAHAVVGRVLEPEPPPEREREQEQAAAEPPRREAAVDQEWSRIRHDLSDAEVQPEPEPEPEPMKEEVVLPYTARGILLSLAGKRGGRGEQ
jgi:hypothetical protein